jgi:glyoxylase-like metal-dependent hydrolase (beta-lactamase superfamily II)
MNSNPSRTSPDPTRQLYFPVAEGVWGTKDVFVNMYFVRSGTEANRWVLIDAGLKTSGTRIKKIAAELFGAESKPDAIIMTHGHFDHVGSLKKLAEEWDVPVYAHYLEMPYLTGRSSYPPPDPWVGGGLMASLSWMYPKSPVDLGSRVEILPEDMSVPFMPGWKWVHTPGHSPGHVSFWRESDRTLIAGDAFVTTKNESVWSVMKQEPYVSGPPKYFTTDWRAAEASVAKLAALSPETAATGHGRPLKGHWMTEALQGLSSRFVDLAVPKQGRYVVEPAIADAGGTRYVPPQDPAVRKTQMRYAVVGASMLAIAAMTLLFLNRGDSDSEMDTPEM